MVTEAISPEFLSKLEARGVSRRSFMKLCGSLAVAAGLSELAAPRVSRDRGFRYRRRIWRPVSRNLDRGRFLHWLYGVVRTGRCP